MIIKRIAIGNKNEAFIEATLTSGINIISSNDNNKGKTIVIQSLMYALGNEPTFPATFDYKNYYHYVEFENNGDIFTICRFKDSFVLSTKSASLLVFNSISELKRYWSKNIFPLPSIIKNQSSRIVDPVLFFQLFFIGQDKKDTSNIYHHGYYNKDDFFNMLYAVANLDNVELNQAEAEKIKSQLNKLKDRRSLLLKQHKILKARKQPLAYLSTSNDKEQFSRKVKDLEKISNNISALRKARTTAATRKTTWNSTIGELQSLNHTMSFGKLRCMDCNSTNIVFSTSPKNSYTFDVSTSQMRKKIIASIQEQIDSYSEDIEKLTAQIDSEQEHLKKLMSEDDISLESIVAFKQDIFDAADAEQQIEQIDADIAKNISMLTIKEKSSSDTKEKRDHLIKKIISIMNNYYNKIDTEGNIIFNDIFTKSDKTISGSEATVFYLAKLLAFRDVFQHSYPIVIDSFRAEDLSTFKESKVLSLFHTINNQVILTTTLKTQEQNKYSNFNYINHIDYSIHESCKILKSNYVAEFSKLLSALSIDLK